MRASATARANGITVNYALDGPEGAPVVMFSNSLLTDYTMWDAQVPALAQEYRILRYDTRGHGRTDATPGAYSIELLAMDALGLLDALGIRSVHFVGLSLGGMITQRLAAMHGDRLQSVILCDTACQLPPASVWEERIALARAKGTSAFVAPMTERWLTPDFRQRNPSVVERLGEMIARTSVDGLIGCACAIRDMDHSALIAQIDLPALIIVGEKDVGTPIAAAEVLQAGIAGSALQVIPDAGHMPNIEQAARFNDTLLGFLARQRAGTLDRRQAIAKGG